ncbi:MAG: hypothetical protein M1826_007051 [Phylliscum demangeonii]|nr:MAG: hypothetical protein M1826_007051 [Phylliscum demangeonii]
MHCSYPLALAVWFATALSLPSSPPAQQAAEPAKGKIDFKTWVHSAGALLPVVLPWLGLAATEYASRQELVRRIGKSHVNELRDLNAILDKKKRPEAYRCMRRCIIQEFEWLYSTPLHPLGLAAAYVTCQQPDRCNLDRYDQLDPETYQKFQLLTERVSHAGHRFAAQAGRTWHAVQRDGGRLETALEKDKVLQVARHEG